MLKIMTLNLNFLVEKHGPWRERRELIAREIQQQSPDIIALQAVRHMTTGLNQADELSRLVPDYSYGTFVAAVEHADRSADGSAFLSRLPAVSIDSLRLTLPEHPEDPTPRVVLHGVFTRPQGVLNLLNCHFSWISTQSVLSVSEVLAFLGPIPGPVVILGDMNSSPESEAMKKLAAQGFTDVWQQLHPGDDGFTFESDQPSLRIDYVWVNEALNPRVKVIQKVGTPAPQPPRLSDHFGLVVTLDA